MRTINKEELKAKIDNGEEVTLVEALPPLLYREGHLPGAINLPPQQVRQLAPNRLPDKHAEIIVYCSNFT